MKTTILTVVLLLITAFCKSQEAVVFMQENLIVGSNSASDTTPISISEFPLKLSPSGRYLINQNDKPFLWAGDAGWSLLVQVSTEDAKLYIDNRAEKGFNVILANILEHYFCTNPPKNYYRQSPFTGVAFQSPMNEKYFAHIDTIINYAASKDIVMFLGPVYLGYADGAGDKEGFVHEIDAATTAQMTTYGNYIGNRYKDFPNIIWFNGGDRNPTVTPNVVAKCNAWATGVLAYDQNHLMTAHNNSESYGINYWNNPSWLTINNVYTRSKSSHTWYKTAYDVTPIKPFFFIEGYYEGQPTNPLWTRQEMRYPEYSSILCGGFGYVFGNAPLFAFGYPVYGLSDWKPAMDAPGSVDFSRFIKFFKDRKWWLLVPDWTHTSLTAGYGTWGNANYAPAARTSDGTSIVAYLPTNRMVTVDMTKITATNSINCQWFDPATGVYTNIGTFPNTGTKTFTPPAAGDWVLVLDAVSIPSFNIVFKNDFENEDIGMYSVWNVYSSEWNNPTWADYNEQFPPEIVNVDYPNNMKSKKALKVNFGKDQNPDDTILQWYAMFPPGDEYYMSYNIRFNPSFDGVISGKYPAMRMGDSWPGFGAPGPDYGSALTMSWMKSGEILYSRAYVYHHELTHEYGDSYSLYESDMTTKYNIPKGEWFNVTIRLVTNDVGSRNGILECFIDGKLAFQKSDFVFREKSNIFVDRIWFTCMFGGSGTEFAPTQNDWYEIDDIHIYTYTDEANMPQGHGLNRPSAEIPLPNWNN
ncbi:MAG: glycoside hydrolase family 140 protein [Dehalococcoidia bacterium]|jgi:hypothetical protein